ncbi:hypothetical protein Emed_001007 [Eimeria media]
MLREEERTNHKTCSGFDSSAQRIVVRRTACHRKLIRAVSASGLEYACGYEESESPCLPFEGHRGLPAACARSSPNEEDCSYAVIAEKQLTGERQDVSWEFSQSPKLHATCCSSGNGDAEILLSPPIKGGAVLAASEGLFEEEQLRGAAVCEKRGARESTSSVLITKETQLTQEGNAALRMKSSIERLYDASLVSIQSAWSPLHATVGRRGWKCRMVASEMEEEKETFSSASPTVSFAATSRTTTAATSRSDQSSTLRPVKGLSLLNTGDVCKTQRLGASLLLGALPVGLLPHST